MAVQSTDKRDYVKSRQRISDDATMRPILIAGPTASGKSALALTLAERLGGTVINADALQVYSCWRSLTARPGPAELMRAPHRLYGHVAANDPYSVGHWIREIRPILRNLRDHGSCAIVVGGTGLYLTALTQGLAPIPPIPPDVRARADAARIEGRLNDLRSDLARHDPETHAAIDLKNPVRVQRAWEVHAATGIGLVAWHRSTLAQPEVTAGRCVVLASDPARLGERIAGRFRAMLAEGALDECRGALQAGWDPDRPASKALGAAALVAHLRGEIGLDAAADASIIATRQFAKRQRTWFRKRMKHWTWIDPDTHGVNDALARLATDPSADLTTEYGDRRSKP